MKQLTLVLLVILTAMASTAQTTWTTDKAHSAVKFSVSHLVISEVEGNFNDFDATMTVSKSDLSDAKIEATIKTASINTANEGRDKHLRADDFLNAEKYPEIKFKSTSIEKTGDNSYKITGDLTIRDVTKQVVLDTKYNGEATDPWGNIKRGFKATTTINRMEYGVKWAKALETGGLVVGKDVSITLLFQLTKPK